MINAIDKHFFRFLAPLIAPDLEDPAIHAQKIWEGGGTEGPSPKIR
jgi:hypothetical protein